MISRKMALLNPSQPPLPTGRRALLKGRSISPFAPFPCRRQAKGGFKGDFHAWACLPVSREGRLAIVNYQGKSNSGKGIQKG
jgi:hypothetical protein